MRCSWHDRESPTNGAEECIPSPLEVQALGSSVVRVIPRQKSPEERLTDQAKQLLAKQLLAEVSTYSIGAEDLERFASGQTPIAAGQAEERQEYIDTGECEDYLERPFALHR